ncbi:MAG: hypothetical protein EXS14_01320 [Planctomycetes bacterium]|nr:hypothetical protein [Planctomycetota bacterium]
MRGLLLLLFLQTALCAQGRVILLGIDGLDEGLTRRFMAEGRLPELSKLAADGAFVALEPTNPAQSPVSWAALTTGMGPGSTGIFGFLNRRITDQGVVPELAGVRVERVTVLSGAARVFTLIATAVIGLLPWLILRRRHPRVALFSSLALIAFLLLTVRSVLSEIPLTLPTPRSTRGGKALWEVLDKAGVPATSLRAPMAFPAPALEHGRLLTGLGTPDLLGTTGSWWLHGSDSIALESARTQMGGTRTVLRETERGTWTGSIAGPRNPLQPEESLHADLSLNLQSTASLVVGESRAVLPAAGFTDFVAVKFPFGQLAPPLQGLTRFCLLSAAPPSLYQAPTGFDPRAQLPIAAITSPTQYGAELCEHGLFDTCGWSTATNPYQDECIDAAVFMQDVRDVLARDEAMLFAAANKGDWRCLFSVLAAPDRVQHVAWSAFDTAHPGHAGSDALLRDAIPWVYAEVDRIVGRLRREVLRPEDTLLLVSDHGFAPFSYAVNVNRWLAEEGLLSVRSGARSLGADLGREIQDVDWSRTQAYHLGLGRVWLNLKGREPHGIVDPAQAPALLARLREGLLGLRYEGRPVLRSVALATELYRGPRCSESADLVLGFERGFRTSWNACLLGADEPLVFENRTRWSGDHCSVDPALVTGVLFSSRRMGESKRAQVLDVLPTVLTVLRVPLPAGLEGRDLGVQQ